MATSYTDPYHMALIAGMRQIFGDPEPEPQAATEPEVEVAAKPKSQPRGKAVQAAESTEAELTTEGVETK